MRRTWCQYREVYTHSRSTRSRSVRLLDLVELLALLPLLGYALYSPIRALSEILNQLPRLLEHTDVSGVVAVTH